MSTELGIPDSWATTNIPELLVTNSNGKPFQQGWSPQCETFPANMEEWGVLKTTAIQAGQFLPHENKKLPEKLAIRPQFEVQSGDILMTCAGPRVRCGITCLVENTRPKLMLSGKMYRFRPHPGLMQAKYLSFYLQSHHASMSIDKMKTGINDSGLNLTHDRFAKLSVPVAPLPEQERIVEKIETLFAQLGKGEEAVREVQKLLARYRQSVLKAAVTGQLTADWRAERKGQLEQGSDLLARILKTRRDEWSGRGKYRQPKVSKHSDLPDLPEIWQWTNMDALIIHGPQNGIYLPQSKYGDGAPIIRIDDFQTGWVRPVESLRKANANPSEIGLYALKKGDLVINRVNSISHLGKTMLVDAEHEGALFESNMMRLSASPHVDVSYLELYLGSAIGRKRLIANCKHAVNQASINQGDVGTTPVPLPPLEEQREIALLAKERLAKTDELVDWCATELKRSASLRQSILKDAFAGKLVPQDPTDEPASVLLARIAAEKLPHKKTRRKTPA